MENKQFEILKWILVAAVLFMLYKLLNKFGLLGQTDDEKGARELELGTITKDIRDDKQTQQNVKRATGKKKPNAQDILRIVSDSSTMLRLSTEIYNAHGITNDDEDAIYNAFRQLKSQYDAQMFAGFFKQRYKKDLFSWLDSFLDSEELAKINQIIKDKKPA